MRISVIGFFLLLVSLNLWSATFEGVNGFRGTDGEVNLTGENCDLLKRQQISMATWKKNLHEKSEKYSTECSCDSIRCYMNIDSVTPSFVKQYLSVDAGRWGPNCWNTALVASKILPVLRYSPPEEMNSWMASELCHAVPEDETPEPGDIVAIRDFAQNEVHAFIFITEELFFTKNYLTTQAPYRLQSASDVFAIFPVPFECRHRLGNPADCTSHANYYRCDSLASFVQAHNIENSPRYSMLDSLVQDQEKRVSQIIFEWKTNPPIQKISPEVLKEARTKVTQIQEEVNLLAKDITLSKDQRLLWNGLKFRIMGLLLSINWIN